MRARLNSKEIGNRLSNLRKRRGYSQAEISKILGISRPSVVQMESGSRKISIGEMMVLAEVLNFSIDRFLSQDYEATQLAPIVDEKKAEMKERISVPKLNVKKFKQVLLYILEKTAGKPNVGETVLYKLLYFADFDFYEQFETHLTGAEYRKMPYGPVPQKLGNILEAMIEDGVLQRISTEYHGFPQKRYIPLQKPDISELSASELSVIEQVLHKHADWSAKKISEHSHKDIPWKASTEGEIIDYELAFYQEAPFSVRQYDEDEF